jgi:DNA replication protein DnaC
MLNQPTIDKLHALRLNAMADALDEQRSDAHITDLSFEDRFGLLVERQYQQSQDRAFMTRLRYAGLSPNGPCVEDINYRHPRNLTRSKLEVLIAPEWIKHGRSALITGATGLGKSYLASALARHACQHNIRTIYHPSPKLFRTLKTSELDGSLPRVLKRLHSTELLVIDDFGIEKAAPAAYRLFLEVLQDRDRRSTLVTSQYTPDSWHQIIKDQTVADAIADRLAFTSYRITLEGESLRRERPESSK